MTTFSYISLNTKVFKHNNSTYDIKISKKHINLLICKVFLYKNTKITKFVRIIISGKNTNLFS